MRKKKLIYWYKRVPTHLLKHFDNHQRFKISISKLEKKRDQAKAKWLLDDLAEDIFKHYQDYNVALAKKYLSIGFKKILLQLNNLEEIKLSDIEQEDNRIKLSQAISETIKQKEEYHNQKLINLKRQGIDISNKKKMSSTVRQYLAIQKISSKYFPNDICIEDLDYKQAQQFRTYLIDQDLSNKTINLYMRQLKSIFGEYEKLDIIAKNPFLVKPLPESRATKIFTNKNIQDIFTSTKFTEEEILILKIALYSGMRLEELGTLRLNNIEDNCFIAIDAKSNKEKIIPIHHIILDEILLRAKSKHRSEYLLFKNYKSQGRIEAIRGSLNRKLKAEYDLTAHKTRATFRTFLENTEAKESFINELMGHSQSGTGNKSYVANRSVDIKRKIIDSIDYNS